MISRTLKKMKDKNIVKIVCYGDSITYGYLCNTSSTERQVSLPYPKILEANLRFKFENPNINVINKGYCGWQTYQGYKNIHENVINLSPDLCIMMFGINDCKGSLAGGLPLLKKNYEKYLNKCVETLTSNNIEVLLLTPTPAFVPRLKTFSSVVFDVAYKHDLICIDMFNKVKATIKIKKENYRDVLLDGIHLRDDAYRYISDIVLKEICSLIN